MTSRFHLVLTYGFFSNCIILAYLITRIVTKEEKAKEYGISLMCLNFFINVMWIVQFTMLIIFRFSHSGEVCSGDYEQYNMVQKNGNW